MKMSKEPRTASTDRVTAETSISAKWTLEGRGQSEIQTTIPFLDHMLTLFAKHGFFDLTVDAKGDTEVDDHHTIEDVGIVLGSLLKTALGGKEGIVRFGWASVPLDETLAQVTVDLSGRPYLVYNVDLPSRMVKTLDLGLFEDFFQAFVSNGGLNLHINLVYGRNPHHKMEAVFKAFAKALAQAITRDERVMGVLSTKGAL